MTFLVLPAPLHVAVGGSISLLRKGLLPEFQAGVVEGSHSTTTPIPDRPWIVLQGITGDGHRGDALRVLRARSPSPTPSL